MEKNLELLKKQLETTRDQFWNVDPASAQLIQSLVFTHQPKSILEIGTSNGYSAICMAEIASQYGGHVSSIEFFEKRIMLAQEHIAQAGFSDSITILKGDALELLTALTTPFDFFFIDANKKEYAQYLEHCIRLASPTAIIIADNTVSHRNQLDDFFSAIQANNNIECLELEIGTGLVIIKIKNSQLQ